MEQLTKVCERQLIVAVHNSPDQRLLELCYVDLYSSQDLDVVVLGNFPILRVSLEYFRIDQRFHPSLIE